ncbi:DUF6415 family natural product biosynthesis protein [Streptomyces sp. NPDC050997]|uniref:DUF6415 family natural product biosynthesis protein n=1 Tax=Streptomyces sp. NPDC050997 TaxID=3155519 RepID=UPI003430F8CB
MTDGRPLDFGMFRQAWTEALELTDGLPAKVPDRSEVDRLTGHLRQHVELLAAALEAAIQGQSEDTTDRETARWLLVRTRKALDDGPGPDHRTAAVHVEDLALTCRALATLCRQQLSAPVLNG